MGAALWLRDSRWGNLEGGLKKRARRDLQVGTATFFGDEIQAAGFLCRPTGEHDV